jgi:hypothetical protein
MAEVGDDLDAKLVKTVHRPVGPRPIVAVGRDVRAIVRWPVPQAVEAELTYQREIFFPPIVVSAFLHLIDANTGRERGITVLDAGSKEKRGSRQHRGNQLDDYEEPVNQRDRQAPFTGVIPVGHNGVFVGTTEITGRHKFVEL